MARPPRDGFDLYYTAKGIDLRVCKELALAITKILDKELADGQGPWGPTGFPRAPVKTVRPTRPTMRIVIGPSKPKTRR
jgi:hypothetical protein